MSFSRDAFFERFGVPRETRNSFDVYAGMLGAAQLQMNLVGPSTLNSVWDRHFADSAQLSILGPKSAVWLDMGSGAGFPGLVLALLGHGPMHLVEATSKKAAFLQQVCNALHVDMSVEVHCQRLENLALPSVEVITARACAPLLRLFDWGARFAGASTLWLLPKGQQVAQELAAARERYNFEADLVPSLTSPASWIVVARDVRQKHR